MKHEFNINNYVEFDLTSKGAEILNKQEKEMSSALPKYIKKHYSEGDMYRNQLWVVLKLFGGENINVGEVVFCKECTISFETTKESE